MEGFSLVDIYSTKGIEYLIAANNLQIDLAVRKMPSKRDCTTASNGVHMKWIA